MVDEIFDLSDVLVRHFNSAACRHLHVDGELPGIGLREEGPAQKRIDRQTGHE